MSDTDPIIDFRPELARRAKSGRGGIEAHGHHTAPSQRPQITVFTRQELQQILRVYGRMVAAGEWRDYALDMGQETASFSVFRRSSECPLYRIEKTPKLARKQGAYSVVSATGVILKRGAELARVLAVFDKSLRLVAD
ncbi:MAG: DUF2794 domain-containing protein [Hyphomicrobiaceae bacterium]